MKRRHINIISFASEKETQQISDILSQVDYGWQIVEAERFTGQDDIPLLLILGEDHSQDQWEIISNKPVTIALLISYDPQVLNYQPLLACSEELIVAPFDDNALNEKLNCRFNSGLENEADLMQMNLIGRDQVFRQMLSVVQRVSSYDVPVLLKGETGTGKEMVARAIHYTGARSGNPFVPVNCSAFNDDLFISELFGHEKGAFTDAKERHMGLVEQANGGTLFLDEIDSLSFKAQGALLRFLQDQEYRPIGSKIIKKADVRIISATNKALNQMVEGKRFREDLFYRLDILDVELPPLRQRREDIVLLSAHFLDQFSLHYNQPQKYLHPDTLDWMSEYHWPGNVRELQNYIHRIYILSNSRCIYVPTVKGRPTHMAASEAGLADQPTAGFELGQFNKEKEQAINQFERRYVERLLKATKGNISHAARKAGKERVAFRRLLKKHGINRDDFIQ